MSIGSDCCNSSSYGPGYESPLIAMKTGSREEYLYISMISCDKTKPDYLATVDVNPLSPRYQQVINRVYAQQPEDEFHHFGWNTCSSCHGDQEKKRRFLIIGTLKSSRLYVIDTTDIKDQKIHKIVEADELKKWDLSTPHTIHCLGSGEIMVSCLGNAKGENPGGFALLDQGFNVIGRWGLHENGKDDTKDTEPIKNFYDFWYQPRHNIMVSSEWAAPNTFGRGFSLLDVAAGRYGHHLHFWNWNERTLLKSIDLGKINGSIPLELRFLHDPDAACGYVVAALSGCVHRFYKYEDEWKSDVVISISAIEGILEGANPTPALITDFLISLDDRFLYLTCWFHGDVRQYYIGDRTEKPRLCSQIWLGGLLKKNSDFKLEEYTSQLTGGPQMIQLSLDGKRLYVTNSLYTSWDDQFYPDIKKHGSYLVRINCKTDTDDGGMELDQDFFLNFGKEPNGPARAHEIRYPGGDCTSDIWV